MATNSNRVSAQKDRTKSYRDMSYREKPATPNSPSGTTVTTVYDHMLSPPSPTEEEEKGDRLRNDLLDEICNDMGIDDSMDLDFDDFCYDAQKASTTPGQRFGQINNKTEGESRRTSISTTTSTSGYATSDSLCAIAKLTHSISNENSSEVDGKRDSPESGSVKQEPVTCGDTEPLANVNDTDQGKAAAAACRLAIQKQLSEGNNSSEMKRKRAAGETMSQDMASEPICSMNEQPSHFPSNSQQSAASQRSQQTYVDYSYQDDFAMEDMPAADSMINFSELPQQPNYYQCPQTAHDNLNLGFNMSIHQQHGQQNFTQLQPTHIPNAHQQPTSQGFGRLAFGGMPQQSHSNDVTMGRASPQFRMQNPFQSPSGQMPQHKNPFQPFQSQQSMNASGPSSLHSQAGFQRSESFPGSHPYSSNLTVTQSQASLQHSPPQARHQKSSSAQSSGAGGSSVPSSSSAAGPQPPIGPSPIGPAASQQDFMKKLIKEDRSSAFRSHPLFPLLRDLIIADMNFQDPAFPHQLILNLPSDFEKLLKNYRSRNPSSHINYQNIPSVESVVMDALKYAHHTLIEKIRQKKSQQQLGAMPANPNTPRNPMSAGPSPLTAGPSALAGGSDYCDKFDESIKHEITQGQAGYGRNPMNIAPSTAPFRPSRRESGGSVYGGEMGPQTPGSTFNQPLTVDTGCVSPSSRHTTALAPASTQQSSNMYTPAQTQPPPHYHHPGMPVGYARSPHQANPRNPYMTPNPHGGPPCPPPNYTVSPTNPPLSRHQQTMYDMGPPPSGPGMYPEPNSPYHDPYNSCMPPPPTAHHPRLHHMGGADRHLVYMNNINDGSLVKTIMEGGVKDMYETMSDSGSIISGHSMQGSVKGQPQGQGKPTEGRKHASLPKEAVGIMLSWLREHQDKPYPNDDEKGMLIKQTGLSITQINYWFTNARRRLLPKWRGEDM